LCAGEGLVVQCLLNIDLQVVTDCIGNATNQTRDCALVKITSHQTVDCALNERVSEDVAAIYWLNQR